MSAVHSRRAFVKSLAIGSLGLLAAACAPAAPSAPSASSASSAGQQAPAGQAAPAAPTAVSAPAAAGVGNKPPAKRPRLVVGAPRPIFESNDVVRGWDQVVSPMYEMLVGMDESGTFVPQLAEKWQVEPNQKDYRFFLRQGVQFHNNMGELTAEDVKLTFERIMGQGQSNNPIAQELRDIIDHLEIVNPYEVVFVNKVPDATLPMFCSPALHTAIVSKRDLDARGGEWPGLSDITTPPLAGTGPWQLKSRTLNTNVVFERVPYKHWRVDPEFQELELRFIPEVSTRLASLLNGEVAITALTRDTRSTAVQRGMQVLRGKRANIGVFVEFMGSYVNDPDGDAAKGYKYPDSPVMDLRVRKALSKAIDREALNRLFLNEGVPMSLKFHNEEADGLNQGFNPDWKARFADEYGYDPAAARDLLAAAGYSASQPLQLTIELQNGAPNLPEQNDVLEAIGEMWRAVGVQPSLETLDAAGYTTKQRALGFDNHVYLFGAGQPQNFVYQRVLTARRQQRGMGFENYDFEKAYYDFIHALDPAKHDELWRAAGDLDYAQHQAIPLFWLYQEFVADPKVVASFEFSGTSNLTYNWMWNVKAA